MTYNEFVTYLAEQILAVRTRENRGGFARSFSSYADAAYKAALDCRSFFDRFSLDEGPHNDYNPNSKVSVEGYRSALYEQIAAAISKRAGAAGVQHNVSFLDSVLEEKVGHSLVAPDQKFSRVAAEYLAHSVFERTCAGCGAKYKVEIKAQTYRMISHHPATCTPVRTPAVHPAPVRVTPAPAAPAQSPKTMSDTEVESVVAESLMMRYMRWEARQKCRTGPVIPTEMLEPSEKHPYNSPEYRAKVKAALRLYADFLKFYEEDPSPKSHPESNQQKIDNMYNIVMRTVFNFDPNASKKNQ